MNQDDDSRSRLDRRSYIKYLSGTGIVGTGLLAGCSGDGGGDTPTATDDSNEQSPEETETEETDGSSDGTPSSSDITIGMETHFTSGAWVTALVEGAQFYALDNGYEFELFTNGQDAQTQISNINQMVNQGYDGIIVVPWNSDAVTGAIEDAREEGIAVYTVDIDAPTEAVSMNVSWNDVGAAAGAGEILVSKMRDQHPDVDDYSILEVRAPPGQNISAARHDPFIEYVEDTDGVEVVGTLNGEWSQSTANQRVREWVNANEAPDGIFAANFAMGLGAQDALEALDLQAPVGEDDHITHVQLDGSSGSHQAIEDGYIDHINDQPVYFYGAIAVEYMVDEIRNGQESLPEVGTEITADDLEIQPGQYKGVELWSEPVWAPATISETDSGHRRFVTDYVEITADNASEPYLWGNIWT